MTCSGCTTFYLGTDRTVPEHCSEVFVTLFYVLEHRTVRYEHTLSVLMKKIVEKLQCLNLFSNAEFWLGLNQINENASVFY